jgi:hypothetical protein
VYDDTHSCDIQLSFLRVFPLLELEIENMATG